jgi:MFS family permease
MTMAGANMGFFLKPMRDELDFAQVDFGWMNTTRIIGGAVTATVLGRMIDRYGPRYLLAAIGVLIGILMVLMGRVNEAWQAIAIFAAIGALGFQGGGQILTTVTPAKWFIRERARAMAYVYMGIPISIIFAFPLTQFLIDQYGWRDTWTILGVGGAVFTIPVSLIFLRREPEDMGLLPDGVDPATVQSGASAQASGPIEHQFTRAEAIRTPAFWGLTFAFGIQMFSMATIGVFRIPHFQDQGISDTLVSWVGPMDGITAVVMALAMAAFVVRFGAQRMAVSGFLLLAVNNVLMVLTKEPIVMFISGAAWGFSLAILGVMQNTIWADYFGRRNLGSIRGFSFMAILAFSAVGGPITGFVGDATGSLVIIWWATAAALTVSALVIMATPKPTLPVAAETAKDVA